MLLSAVFKPLRRTAPGLTLVALATTAGLLIWNWNDPTDLVSGALRLDDLAISISLIAIAAAAFAVLLSIREPAAEQAGSGEYHALLLGSVLGMVLLAQAQNLVSFFVAIETLSIPLYILCATDMIREKLARVRAQVPDRRLARLGDAALRDGLPLRRLGLDRLPRHLRRHRPRRAARRPAGPRRHRPGRRRARLQDLDRPLPPVDARRLRGRSDADHLLHGGGDQGGGLRRLRPLLRRRPDRRGGRLAAGARRAGRDLDRDRQRRRARPGLAQAPARLLRRRPGRLHPRRPGGRQRGRGQRDRLLPRRLPLHEPGRLQRDRRARARDRLRRRHPRRARARAPSGRCSPGR